MSPSVRSSRRNGQHNGEVGMNANTDTRPASLPEKYSDLETWADRFAHATERERYCTRATAAFSELEAFYKALLPRMPAILDDLADQPPDGSAPAEMQRLANLGCAFMDVSLSIEIFKQPIGTEGLDWRRIGILF